MAKKTTTQLQRAKALAKEDLLLWALVKPVARARYMERAKR